MKSFYRVHRAELPELCAANAYSAEWGSCFVSPSEMRCGMCGGDGTFDDGSKCQACDGTGTEEAIRGYSCCESLEQLAAYFATHAGAVDASMVEVYEFQADEADWRPAGYGGNEYLATPVDATIRKLATAEWLPAFEAEEAVA